MADEKDLPPEDEFEEFDQDFDMDELFDEEESEEEELEENNTVPSDDEEEQESDEEEEDKESSTAKEPVASVIPSTEEASDPINPEEIPINIAVEVTRLQIDVKTLMELEPGNMLQLNSSPEQGVKLVAGGKTLAHGELIRVGDLLGVRILEIGK